jgi:FKBP-type peptidyl-prolyl cis-trans isomerase SlyD
VIVWVGADEVKLDFNHPLAGRELEFEVKVVGLREATEEELEHGHAHMEGHAH